MGSAVKWRETGLGWKGEALDGKVLLLVNRAHRAAHACHAARVGTRLVNNGRRAVRCSASHYGAR